jgi:hypothetical protein
VEGYIDAWEGKGREWFGGKEKLPCLNVNHPPPRKTKCNFRRFLKICLIGGIQELGRQRKGFRDYHNHVTVDLRS